MKPTKPTLTAPSFVSSIERILMALWYTPGVARDDGQPGAGLPAIFTSRPGVGKSSRIRAAARSANLHLETVISSLREPSDFVGLPVPSTDGVMSYVPAACFVRADEAGHAVVFLDEINTAPQATQMALLRVVLEGVAGDMALPNSVRFVAAMNGAQDTPGRWDLDPALANRFLHLPWPTANAQEFGRWLVGGAEPITSAGGDPAERWADVMTRWPGHWAKARGAVAAFVARRPELLEAMPAAGDPAASAAYPSPRSWEMGARALASAALHGLPEQDADALLAGAVGAGAALEFAMWREAADLPDPFDVLDAKVAWAHDGTRPDRTMATLSGCAAVLLDASCAKRKERSEVMFKHLLACVQGGAADMAVLATQSLMESKAHRVEFMGAPSFKAALASMAPFTTAAGMGAR